MFPAVQLNVVYSFSLGFTSDLCRPGESDSMRAGTSPALADVRNEKEGEQQNPEGPTEGAAAAQSILSIPKLSAEHNGRSPGSSSWARMVLTGQKNSGSKRANARPNNFAIFLDSPNFFEGAYAFEYFNVSPNEILLYNGQDRFRFALVFFALDRL